MNYFESREKFYEKYPQLRGYHPINDPELIVFRELINQPERSKREDSLKCEMRCSEHCGNTVRDK